MVQQLLSSKQRLVIIAEEQGIRELIDNYWSLLISGKVYPYLLKMFNSHTSNQLPTTIIKELENKISFSGTFGWLMQQDKNSIKVAKIILKNIPKAVNIPYSSLIEQSTYPIIQAAHPKVSKAWYALFLHYKADLKLCNNSKQNSLHILSAQGQIDKLKILFKKTKNNHQLITLIINSQNQDGSTPLHLAKDANIAQLLIQYGASLNIKNYNGKTPSEYNLAVQKATAIIERSLLEDGYTDKDKDGEGKKSQKI